MDYIEIAKKYIQENKKEHWLTKALISHVEKNKVPEWAIKELEKRKYCTSTSVHQIEEEQEEQEEVQEESTIELSPFCHYDNMDRQWAEWVDETFTEETKQKELKMLEEEYKKNSSVSTPEVKKVLTEEYFKEMDKIHAEIEKETREKIAAQIKQKQIAKEKFKKERELEKKLSEEQMNDENENDKNNEIVESEIQEKEVCEDEQKARIEDFLKPQIVPKD